MKSRSGSARKKEVNSLAFRASYIGGSWACRSRLTLQHLASSEMVCLLHNFLLSTNPSTKVFKGLDFEAAGDRSSPLLQVPSSASLVGISLHNFLSFRVLSPSSSGVSKTYSWKSSPLSSLLHDAFVFPFVFRNSFSFQLVNFASLISHWIKLISSDILVSMSFTSLCCFSNLVFQSTSKVGQP